MPEVIIFGKKYSKLSSELTASPIETCDRLLFKLSPVEKSSSPIAAPSHTMVDLLFGSSRRIISMHNLFSRAAFLVGAAATDEVMHDTLLGPIARRHMLQTVSLIPQLPQLLTGEQPVRRARCDRVARTVLGPQEYLSGVAEQIGYIYTVTNEASDNELLTGHTAQAARLGVGLILEMYTRALGDRQ